MDRVLVGTLTGLAAVVGLLVWQLRVRPDVALSWWTARDPAREASARAWVEHHPGAVRALRVAGGGIVFLLGFLTGLAATFLRATSGG